MNIKFNLYTSYQLLYYKFLNENTQVWVSPINGFGIGYGEINEELKDFAAIMLDKSKYIESLLNELNNFRSDSKKGNDQIDDSIAALQVIKKDVDDCNDDARYRITSDIFAGTIHCAVKLSLLTNLSPSFSGFSFTNHSGI